jgi:hypothetical protein
MTNEDVRRAIDARTRAQRQAETGLDGKVIAQEIKHSMANAKRAEEKERVLDLIGQAFASGHR